ncbi:MAG: hemerythrin domain-containing protein, partial [Nostoc sp.]
ELFDEQAHAKLALEEIKALSPSSPQFKDKAKQLLAKLGDHIRQEETTLFAAIRNNLTTEQSEQLATEFKAAKTRIQQKLGVVTESKV